MSMSIPRKKSALSPAAALRTGSASPGVYNQAPSTARGQPTNRPPSPPLRSARAYKPATPTPAPVDLSWLPPPPPPPLPTAIADPAADLVSAPPMTARGRSRDVSFIVDVSPARASPAVDADTRAADEAAAHARQAKQAALAEQHAAEAAAAKARIAKQKAEAELRAAELRAMEEATERARKARQVADAERADAEHAVQLARKARAAAEAEERTRAIQEATERARRHLVAQRDVNSSVVAAETSVTKLSTTAVAAAIESTTNASQIELSTWVANPLARIADGVPGAAAPIVNVSAPHSTAAFPASALAPLAAAPDAATSAPASVPVPAAIAGPSPPPAADTSKECGPVFVCVPCLQKPMTLGYILLSAALALILILMIASAAVAAQRATSGGTSASSYFGTQIDKPEWSYQDVILPLPWDFAGNVSKLLDVFNTTTPNPFLPLLCSSVTAMCNYSNWQGGTSDFDLLGPGNDNYVPLSLTGGAIDRSNYVRLELSFTNFQPSTTGGTVALNWRLALPPHMVNANRAPSTSLLTVQCQIGRFLIAAAQGSGDTSGQLTLPLDSGTISFFPLDVYTKTLALFCTVSDPASQFLAYTKTDPDARKLLSVVQQPLSFILKIDKSDTGLFAHADDFTAAPISSPTLVNAQAKLSVTWQRPAISCVFPGFIMAAFWIIAIFDILYLTPFLGTGVKLNAPPTVGVCASLLFALPGIRNAMPGNAPVGSVFDFCSYYWAVLIATMCFAYAVSRWCVDVHPPLPMPAPAAEKKAQ